MFAAGDPFAGGGDSFGGRGFTKGKGSRRNLRARKRDSVSGTRHFARNIAQFRSSVTDALGRCGARRGWLMLLG